jgi:hypothetical protein
MLGWDVVLAAGMQIVNKLIPDPAARAAAELEIFKMKQNGEFRVIEAQLQEMQEVTKRASADMASDSWLSKNIRPLIMVYFLTLISLMAFGLVQRIDDAFLSMVRSFTEFGLMFYFGGRTLEKVTSIIADKIPTSSKGDK